MYTPGWVPSALSRRSALWGGLAAAGALAAGCSNTPVAGPAPPPTGTPSPSPTPTPGPPVTAPTGPPRVMVVGHRGASGYRPEHTLAAYELAIRMGLP